MAQLTATASNTAASSADPAAGSAAVSSASPQKGQAGLLAYSQCMRSHGVPDFPDPVGNGLQVRVSPGSDLDPNAPQMQAAQKACQSLQPGGAQGGTISEAQKAGALKYSACIRAHGVPNFPDPVFSNGGAQLKITGIDPNSAQFQAAQKACQSLQPGGPGAQTNSSGS
ncbi:MAG TPA: hypothetical protein VK662_07605 [Acidothermaceae bacterium]|nr:hypothetical protein [Acidothermaceae bacterium]